MLFLGPGAAGKSSSHKTGKGSPPYSDDEGSDHTSDVEDAEDYKKGGWFATDRRSMLSLCAAAAAQIAYILLTLVSQHASQQRVVLFCDAGGYHPVKLGEKFKQGRYVVLKKLGWGHFSTVWLVLDTHTHTFAALKVTQTRGLMGLAVCADPCCSAAGFWSSHATAVMGARSSECKVFPGSWWTAA